MRKLSLLLAAFALTGTAAQAQSLQADPGGLAPLAAAFHAAQAPHNTSSFAPCVDDELPQNAVTNSFPAGNTANAGAAQELGQSLTVTCTGAIDSLYIVYQPIVGTTGQTVTGNVRWYTGATTTGVPISTTPINFVVPASGFAYTLDLDVTNFAVVEGVQYTYFVDLDGTSQIGMHGSNLNPYAGGTLFLSTTTSPTGGTALSAYDLRFFLEFAPGSTVVANENVAQGTRVALGTGMPNPSSSRATVEFQVREASNVRLAAYDVLGREVAVLAEGAFATGVHSATLDTSRLAAGAYVLRLQAEDEVVTNRLTVTH